MTSFLSACEREGAWLTEFITVLVACESPSLDRVALDACATLLSSRLAAAGATVSRVEARTTADHVLAEWPGAGAPILLLGHFDTVWPVGQLARMPIRRENGKLFGPGVFDMKAGLAIGVLAARVIAAEVPVASRPRIRLFATSDEEVGSGTSRAAIERLAKASSAVLVLEPSLAGGGVKTARKGVGEFEILAHGVSAHAGVDPGAGASAVYELARQILAIERLNDPARGLSLNVGVIDGGTRPNVVAERARAVVDVRIARLEDAAIVEAALRGLAPADSRVRLEVRGGINRPPMERTEGVARLYALARDVARAMGDDLEEGATGGGSDGNFTAALGVPTLDGLGAVGEGPHAIHEHIVVNALPRRAALVAGLMARLAEVG